ncbi:MAG: PadR family transcriptional regulator [Gammaproteobacteria bacterium RBG_16_66_13]|nr:MAG: PadR family transcriptional regulator [Gammaproteobacteria bacterium RBG_16_66_13]
MAEVAQSPESFLPLTQAVFHILLALADGEKHGYAVMQEIEDATEGRVQMGPGTLYGSIKRMLAAGLIEESDDRPDPTLDDERRRYYRQTGLGRKVLREEAERMAELMALARRKHVWSGAGSRSILT